MTINSEQKILHTITSDAIVLQIPDPALRKDGSSDGLVAAPGFEPGSPDYKSGVVPIGLHDHLAKKIFFGQAGQTANARALSMRRARICCLASLQQISLS